MVGVWIRDIVLWTSRWSIRISSFKLLWTWFQYHSSTYAPLVPWSHIFHFSELWWPASRPLRKPSPPRTTPVHRQLIFATCNHGAQPRDMISCCYHKSRVLSLAVLLSPWPCPPPAPDLHLRFNTNLIPIHRPFPGRGYLFPLSRDQILWKPSSGRYLDWRSLPRLAFVSFGRQIVLDSTTSQLSVNVASSRYVYP